MVTETKIVKEFNGLFYLKDLDGLTLSELSAKLKKVEKDLEPNLVLKLNLSHEKGLLCFDRYIMKKK